ncbi:MAG TPA: hypothetical protein VK181_23445 [Rhizobium sp.]|nr:hypothetical protein [Rhizobium sp.]
MLGDLRLSPYLSFRWQAGNVGLDCLEGVQYIRAIYVSDKSFNMEILASSIRTTLHETQSAVAGADIATVPTQVLRKLVEHPPTEKGLASFLADRGRTGQTYSLGVPLPFAMIFQWRNCTQAVSEFVCFVHASATNWVRNRGAALAKTLLAVTVEPHHDGERRCEWLRETQH